MNYEPDEKTLIRHAMAALDGEIGVNEAWKYNRVLLKVFRALRKRENRLSPLAGINDLLSPKQIIEACGGIDSFVGLKPVRKDVA